MKHANKHGILFHTYMEGRIWVTDVMYENLKFRFNNSYDYFPNYENFSVEDLCKLLNVDINSLMFKPNEIFKIQTSEELLESINLTDKEFEELNNKDMEIIVNGKLTTKSKAPKVETKIVETKKPGRKPRK